MGQLGGPLALPADISDPEFPLVASIDCAAIPEHATDIPLPADGRLLLFGYPDDDSMWGAGGGSVVYVPHGAAVETRKQESWYTSDPDAQRITDQYAQGELSLTPDICLPFYGCVDLPEPPFGKPLPGHPRSEELCDAWICTADQILRGGVLQIGGYACDEYQGSDVPLLSSTVDNPEGWVLLAEWRPQIEGREGATIHWGIRRQDLAALRFDEVSVNVFWNP
ncbi:DUF1963 domain-containing protein [Actinospica sp.]|uniref:DUF1963 domain-containing protein n=1 Tax=Actinospica sp. TaxID=1872142 RepID=UPI002CBB7910|nr:DUF1963 domain-containing protein [Actinospica sp.]HWG26041.1 DUF1963 domain-containing protein [Actinospica sp.]